MTPAALSGLLGAAAFALASGACKVFGQDFAERILTWVSHFWTRLCIETPGPLQSSERAVAGDGRTVIAGQGGWTPPRAARGRAPLARRCAWVRVPAAAAACLSARVRRQPHGRHRARDRHLEREGDPRGDAYPADALRPVGRGSGDDPDQQQGA
ncbi:hypothetical protein [Streptomyces sp. NPDC127197]|uniref:hypothetical protein n=1 Tax=Streptomyces sp. NPDC127197 TaxID=3345388 RepID=UPI0036341340